MRIYLLQDYPEEVIAVAFAKTSRSPEPFDKIADELNADKARKFHEKWVVGYGHSSVAEHAIAHIAIEDVSRYAVDWIESARLASFTEKSTRYQIIDKNSYYVPETKHRDFYISSMNTLFDNYLVAFDTLKKYFLETMDEPSEIKARVKALDRARFILPYATLANVGMTINARELAHTLRKMLSSGVKEVQLIANNILEESKKELPTLLKHTEATDYLKKSYTMLDNSEENKPLSFSAKLLDYTKDAEEKLIAALMFKRSHKTYEEALELAKNMGKQEKQQFLAKYLSIGKFDIPARELEHISYTLELTMDLGAYYEFKRHRMLTLSQQMPTTKLGYYMPSEFKEVSLEELFKHSMKVSDKLYDVLKEENLQPYAVTNAHIQRMLVTVNLRELFHYLRLRMSPMAHFTIRTASKKIYDELMKATPSLIGFIKPRD